MLVAATTTDLMDRSRISAAIPGVVFAAVENVDPATTAVIVDLARDADQVRVLRASLPHSRIICYGPHVDDDAAGAARAAGADVVLARSRFFRDPAAVITG